MRPTLPTARDVLAMRDRIVLRAAILRIAMQLGDRVAQLPAGRPARIRPDWVCELLSPSNAKRDLVDKFQVLHTNQVPHYWIADPVEKALIVHRWEPRGYLVVLTAGLGEVVRAEPFEAMELRISALFGIEDEEE